MALTVQNLRAIGTGVEPASLLPGQIAFNVTDKVLYVGDNSNFKTSFDGTQAPGVPGEGWYAMPMDFSSLGDYYVPNPGYWGDVPTDQQVLTWSTALNHPIWTNGGGGGGGSQVYVVTNTDVASAPGATTSAKITAAIGVASPDEGDVTIVTGIPDDVYEGLYFFTTEWVKGAAYAYPSASEVIYDNTSHPTLTPTVQGAISDLDDGLAATTAIANTANSTANSALSIASAALPKAGGTMTGTIISRAINVQSGYDITLQGSDGISFNSGAGGTILGISDLVTLTSATTAASSTAVRSAYNLAQAAVPRSTYTAAGDLVVGTGASAFTALPIGPVDYILASTGTGINWVAQSEGDVTGVTGTSPIVIDNTDPQNPIVTINASSTTQPGAVQLNDTLASTSTTEALTAKQGYQLQQQIDNLTLASNVTLGGSFDCVLDQVDSTTSAGQAAGLVVGSNLPSPAVAFNDIYVVVTVAGSYTPPGGGGPYNAQVGDWFLCGETSTGSGIYVWQYLGVGARPAYATTASAGIVQLADNLATQGGGSATLAVTPAGLQSKVSDSTSTTSSTTIASSTAVKAAYDFAVAAIPCATITAVGDIVVGGVGAAPTALPVGTDGQVLVANSACATGLEWVSDTPGDVTSVTATSPVTADNTDPQNPIIGIDAASTTQAGAVQLDDTVTSASTTEAATANAAKTAYDAGIQGQTDAAAAQATANAAVPCASFLAKGNILGGTAAGTYSALTVGTNGQVLLANSACATGLEWGNACYVPDACFTALGDLVVGTGIGTYSTLTSGTNGQVLLVDTTCATGLKWGTALQGYTCSLTPFNTALGANAGDSVTTGINNTALGYNSGTALTGGNNNTFVGFSAGDATTSSDNNTAVGSNALGAGGVNNNTAIGFCAGGSLTTGGSNTFVGGLAGRNATTADNSVAVGYNAMAAAAAGNGGVAVGASALNALTSGAGNTAVGYQAADSVTTGARNTVVGHTSGGAITTGTDNTIIGACAANLATGTSSTILGSCAGAALTLGGANVFLGANAGDSVTTGFNNTIIGDVSGSTSLTGNLILAAGTTVKFQANGSGAWSPDGTNYGTAGQVLASQGSGAVPVWCTLSLACVPCSAYTGQGVLLAGTGVSTFSALPVGSAGQVLTVDLTCTEGVKWSSGVAGYTCGSATFNTAYGCQAGDSVTTGTDNVTLGYNAGTAITTGSQNVVIGSGAAVSSNAVGVVAIGFCSGQALTSAGCVTHIGYVSGRNATGLSNTYVGALTGCAASNTSACGTLLGFCAGSALTTGNGNVLVGFQSGRNVNSGANNVAIGTAAFQTATTAASNVAVGCGALAGLSTSAGNTALGHRAMLNASTAANNVVIGCSAGEQISTGSTNVFIGNTAGDVVTTGSSNTIIGDVAGSTALTGNVILAAGTTTKFQANENGAWSPDGANYGTAGQVLTSAGTGAVPAWTTPTTIGTYKTVTSTTTSVTPYVLLSVPINNGVAVNASFTAVNATQGKIWTQTTNAVALGASVDSNSGNDLASIGGTTRAATIAWSVSGSNLIATVTPNFADSTTATLVYSVNY